MLRNVEIMFRAESCDINDDNHIDCGILFFEIKKLTFTYYLTPILQISNNKYLTELSLRQWLSQERGITLCNQ